MKSSELLPRDVGKRGLYVLPWDLSSCIFLLLQKDQQVDNFFPNLPILSALELSVSNNVISLIPFLKRNLNHNHRNHLLKRKSENFCWIKSKNETVEFSLYHEKSENDSEFSNEKETKKWRHQHATSWVNYILIFLVMLLHNRALWIAQLSLFN